MKLDCKDFHSEILHSHLAKLQSEVLSVGLSIVQPVSALLVVATAGSGCCELPL